MDDFVWVKTTSGKSFINLADVSVICFTQHEEKYKDSCDIHLKSGTIFTTLTTPHGDKFFEAHENYLCMIRKARTY